MTYDSSTTRGPGLGKGLAALLGEKMQSANTDSNAGAGTLQEVAIQNLVPDPAQPRKRFDDQEIDNLAASIREKGIVQPIIVRPSKEGDGFQIVAGERRWRAAQKAGLHLVPAVIRSLTDKESLEFALVENLQRSDLDPLEEAQAYRRLMADFGHRQEDIGAALGKSRSHVANVVRLLELPDGVKTLLTERTISAGHARALLSSSKALDLAREVVRRNLTVRQTEALVRKAEAASQTGRSSKATTEDPNIVALQRELANELGLNVVVYPKVQGGRITINYKTPEQLDAIVGRLRRRIRA